MQEIWKRQCIYRCGSFIKKHGVLYKITQLDKSWQVTRNTLRGKEVIVDFCDTLKIAKRVAGENLRDFLNGETE